MVSSELIGLLLNKYVLGAGAVLVALILAYFKGSNAAEDAAKAAEALQERARSAKLRAAEAKNAHLEKTGAAKNEKINNAGSIDELLGLWDQINSPKGSGGDADKDPK